MCVFFVTDGVQCVRKEETIRDGLRKVVSKCVITHMKRLFPVLGSGWYKKEYKIAYDYRARHKQRKVKLIVSLLLKVLNYTAGVQTGTTHDNGIFFSKMPMPSSC